MNSKQRRLVEECTVGGCGFCRWIGGSEFTCWLLDDETQDDVGGWTIPDRCPLHRGPVSVELPSTTMFRMRAYCLTLGKKEHDAK